MPIEKHQFKTAYSKYLQTSIIKLMERSPLKYPLPKSVSYLDLAVAMGKEAAENRPPEALKLYVSNGLISATRADKIIWEFKKL